MKDSFAHCGIHSLTPDLKFFDPNVLIHQPCWHVSWHLLFQRGLGHGVQPLFW